MSLNLFKTLVKGLEVAATAGTSVAGAQAFMGVPVSADLAVIVGALAGLARAVVNIVKVLRKDA